MVMCDNALVGYIIAPAGILIISVNLARCGKGRRNRASSIAKSDNSDDASARIFILLICHFHSHAKVTGLIVTDQTGSFDNSMKQNIGACCRPILTDFFSFMMR